MGPGHPSPRFGESGSRQVHAVLDAVGHASRQPGSFEERPGSIVSVGDAAWLLLYLRIPIFVRCPALNSST